MTFLTRITFHLIFDHFIYINNAHYHMHPNSCSPRSSASLLPFSLPFLSCICLLVSNWVHFLLQQPADWSCWRHLTHVIIHTVGEWQPCHVWKAVFHSTDSHPSDLTFFLCPLSCPRGLWQWGIDIHIPFRAKLSSHLCSATILQGDLPSLQC